MITDHYVEDLNQFKGQELEFKIVEIEPSENRLILSHKEIIQAQHEKAAEKVFAELQPGDVVEGKVARMTNFGAFIDLGGVDGLVHVSEISYDHVDRCRWPFTTPSPGWSMPRSCAAPMPSNIQ